jgi:hypothetical protein
MLSARRSVPVYPLQADNFRAGRHFAFVPITVLLHFVEPDNLSPRS